MTIIDLFSSVWGEFLALKYLLTELTFQNLNLISICKSEIFHTYFLNWDFNNR